MVSRGGGFQHFSKLEQGFVPFVFFFLYKYVVSRVQVDRCMDNGYCIKGMSTVPEMYERGKGKCH